MDNTELGAQELNQGVDNTTDNTSQNAGANANDTNLDNADNNGGVNNSDANVTDNKINQTGNDNQYYGAPDDYDFKGLQLPDGIELNAEMAEKFAPLGKELNLSQQGANKLANFLAEIQKEQLTNVSDKFAEYKKQEDAALQLSYEKLLNTDKEIGAGDKAKMNAYLDVADVGYKEFASDELKNTLSSLHLDYHPAIIKHFYRLGKLCGNDKIANTGKPAVKTDAADVLYGNSEE